MLSNTTNGYIAGSIWINTTANGQNFDGDFMIMTYLAYNDPTVRIYSLDGDGGVDQFSSGDMLSTTDIMITYTYTTA